MSKNEGHVSFFLLFWLDLAVHGQTCKGNHNNTTCLHFFYQNEDGNLYLRCCRRSACLFCCCSVWHQWIVCIAHPASVTPVARGASVTRLHFLLILCEFFIECFVVVLDVLVAGDLRHEYALSTWGFPFRGPPGCWLCLLCLHCGDCCSFDDDCCHGMSIIVILTTSSRRFCHIHRQSRLVAPRVIPTALLATLEGCSSCERYGALQWLRQLHPSWSVMASIMPIAIGDGAIACCCLSWLCLVPTLASCSQVGILIV